MIMFIIQFVQRNLFEVIQGVNMSTTTEIYEGIKLAVIAVAVVLILAIAGVLGNV